MRMTVANAFERLRDDITVIAGIRRGWLWWILGLSLLLLVAKLGQRFLQSPGRNLSDRARERRRRHEGQTEGGALSRQDPADVASLQRDAARDAGEIRKHIHIAAVAKLALIRPLNLKTNFHFHL